jgi:hypothetical protein
MMQARRVAGIAHGHDVNALRFDDFQAVFDGGVQPRIRQRGGKRWRFQCSPSGSALTQRTLDLVRPDSSQVEQLQECDELTAVQG